MTEVDMNPFLTSELATLHHRDLIAIPAHRRHRPGRFTTLRRNPSGPATSI
jgi:hypothetical protein